MEKLYKSWITYNCLKKSFIVSSVANSTCRPNRPFFDAGLCQYMSPDHWQWALHIISSIHIIQESGRARTIIQSSQRYGCCTNLLERNRRQIPMKESIIIAIATLLIKGPLFASSSNLGVSNMRTMMRKEENNCFSRKKESIMFPQEWMVTPSYLGAFATQQVKNYLLIAWHWID